MSSKRRLRRRSCEGKVRHESAAGANIARAKLARRDDDRMNAYHCRFCGGWHVGHAPGSRQW